MLHAEAMQRLVADPVITRYTPKPEPYPAGEAAREIERAVSDREAGTAYCFAILADGEFSGVCKLKEVNTTQGELGYWIALPFWGRGIATRGADLVLDFAFSNLGLHRVVAHTLKENASSSRVLERLGFTLLGSALNTHPKWSTKATVLQFEIVQESRPDANR